MSTHPARRKAADKSVPDTGGRPPIWVDGRQRPAFNVPAFARASCAMALRNLLPVIDDATARLAISGQRFQQRGSEPSMHLTGQIPLFYQLVGASSLALGRLFSATRALIAPPQVPPATVADATLGPRPVPTPAPAKQARPIRPVATTEPILHAIRSAIAATGHDFADEISPDGNATRKTAQAALVSVELAPRLDPDAPTSNVVWLGSRALLVAMLPFALPVGAVQAMMYHLDGGDLRDWP